MKGWPRRTTLVDEVVDELIAELTLEPRVEQCGLVRTHLRGFLIRNFGHRCLLPNCSIVWHAQTYIHVSLIEISGRSDALAVQHYVR